MGYFVDRFHQNADNTNLCAENDCAGNECVNNNVTYQKIYYKNAVPDSRVLVFLTGFCLGMVFFYLSGIKLIGGQYFPAALSADNIVRLHDFDFYTAGLFEYVMYKRLGQFVLLLICATSFFRKAFSYAFLGWGGFELGIMTFTLVYQYGLKGILLSLTLLIPHGIFFLVVFLLLFHKYWTGDEKAYHNDRVVTEKGLHKKITKVRKAIIILALWLIGILSEVYINPEIIRKIALLFK